MVRVGAEWETEEKGQEVLMDQDSEQTEKAGKAGRSITKSSHVQSQPRDYSFSLPLLGLLILTCTSQWILHTGTV